MGEIHHVVEHDYSEVNRVAANEQARVAEQLLLQKADRLSLYGTTAMKVCIGIGVVLLALGFLVWLFRGGALVRNIHFVDPGVRATVTEELALVRSEIEAWKDNTDEVSMAIIKEQMDAAEGVSSKFTVFETVDLGAKSEIVTGRNYLPSNTKEPISQFCYFTPPATSPIHGKRVMVGERVAMTDPVIWFSDDVPSDILAKGQQHCRFLPVDS